MVLAQTPESPNQLLGVWGGWGVVARDCVA